MTPKRILFIGSYADPNPIGSNRGLAAQAEGLGALGHEVDILTWPNNCNWTGPIPGESDSRLAGMPYRRMDRMGLRYHVIKLPPIWGDRVMTANEWEDAVSWGMRAIRELGPDLVHQHYWQNLSYMMTAAINIDVPVVYSMYDYGLACARTVLMTGHGELCNGIVGTDKCADCVLAGRNILGTANEVVAKLPMGSTLLSMLYGSSGQGILAKRGGVRLPVEERIQLMLNRARNIFCELGAAIVTSPFAREFVNQLGASYDRIHVQPWFYQGNPKPAIQRSNSSELRLGYVGRISPEKGVHVLLRALEEVRTSERMTLDIVGAVQSEYASDLVRKYSNASGHHQVNWRGWVTTEELAEFYRSVDAIVIPSLCYDNTPYVLIESIAHRLPVICSDVASMTHLVKDEINGLVFPMGDTSALANVIGRIASEPLQVKRLRPSGSSVPSLLEYATQLLDVYRSVSKRDVASNAQS